jgi:Uma2 family endonuclease
MVITKFSQLDLSKRYTYTDYVSWQFKERVEILKGWVMKMSPAPSVTHQKISWNLSFKLAKYLKNKDCDAFTAPIDVRLNATSAKKIYSVVQPDIIVVCDKEKIDEQGCNGAPDLVIEIASPGNSKRELRTKFQLYEENFVKEYWVINYIEQQLFQYYLKDGKFELSKIHFNEDTLSCHIFPSLKIKLKDLFPNL